MHLTGAINKRTLLSKAIISGISSESLHNPDKVHLTLLSLQFAIEIIAVVVSNLISLPMPMR